LYGHCLCHRLAWGLVASVRLLRWMSAKRAHAARAAGTTGVDGVVGAAERGLSNIAKTQRLCIRGSQGALAKLEAPLEKEAVLSAWRASQAMTSKAASKKLKANIKQSQPGDESLPENQGDCVEVQSCPVCLSICLSVCLFIVLVRWSALSVSIGFLPEEPNHGCKAVFAAARWHAECGSFRVCGRLFVCQARWRTRSATCCWFRGWRRRSRSRRRCRWTRRRCLSRQSSCAPRCAAPSSTSSPGPPSTERQALRMEPGLADRQMDSDRLHASTGRHLPNRCVQGTPFGQTDKGAKGGS
jgi:hypothetical protein